MKRILITGTHGYIGSSLKTFLEQFPESYAVDTVSLRGDEWRSLDFSQYNVLVHAAGLAHIKETPENREDFFRINRDLAIETAKKAKDDGMGQFIFLSSLSVYGMDEGVITSETVPHPKIAYGQSKLEAENEIRKLETDSFRIAILRPPMVYGDGCKGNYQALVKLAKILPICPDYENSRSAVAIENLCLTIKEIIDDRRSGIFVPQDETYLCTCREICRIGASLGRHIPKTKMLNFVPALLRRTTGKGRKAFGDLVYRDESQCGHAGS